MYICVHMNMCISYWFGVSGNLDSYKQIRKSSFYTDGKTGLRRWDFSWVTPQASFLDSRLSIPSLDQARSRAERPNIGQQPLQPQAQGGTDQAQEAIMWLSPWTWCQELSQRPASPTPSVRERFCLLPFRLRQAGGMELSDGLAPSWGFSRTRSEISPVGSLCASQNILNYN